MLTPCLQNFPWEAEVAFSNLVAVQLTVSRRQSHHKLHSNRLCKIRGGLVTISSLSSVTMYFSNADKA